MGQSKRQLEEAEAAKVDKRGKARSRDAKATFVDMRADKVVKSAVGMILTKYGDLAPTIEKAIGDTSMAITVKYSQSDACWILRVTDVDDKWPNITYYTFRHANIATCVVHAGYVMTEQWRGVLPRDIVREDDINW